MMNDQQWIELAIGLYIALVSIFVALGIADLIRKIFMKGEK